MLYFKDEDGINIPIIVAIAEFVKSKGYYICDDQGRKIEISDLFSVSTTIVGVIMENPAPTEVKTYMWGIIRNVSVKPRIYLGYFELSRKGKICFNMNGTKNKEFCLELVKSLEAHLKSGVDEEINIDINLIFSEEKYEKSYENMCDC